MNRVLEDSWDHYKCLFNKMVQSTRDVLTLSQLVEQMQTAHESFAKELEQIASKFHDQIQGDAGDHDGLLFAYQHLSNYLLKISQSHMHLSKNISSEILEPFKTFIENFRQTNRETSTSSKEWLNDMEKKREKLLQSQRIFYQNRKTAESYSEVIEKTAELVEKGQKTQQDLQKVTHRSVELKLEAEESQEDYKRLINHVNLEWEQFSKQFPTIFERFEYNDESRIAFSRQTILKIVQYLQSQNQIDLNSAILYQEKFQEYEKQIVADKRPELWKVISKGTNTQFLERLQSYQEKFTNYEAWKKSQEQDQSKQSYQLITIFFICQLGNLCDLTLTSLNQVSNENSLVNCVSIIERDKSWIWKYSNVLQKELMIT